MSRPTTVYERLRRDAMDRRSTPAHPNLSEMQHLNAPHYLAKRSVAARCPRSATENIIPAHSDLRWISRAAATAAEAVRVLAEIRCEMLPPFTDPAGDRSWYHARVGPRGHVRGPLPGPLVWAPMKQAPSTMAPPQLRRGSALPRAQSAHAPGSERPARTHGRRSNAGKVSPCLAQGGPGKAYPTHS